MSADSRPTLRVRTPTDLLALVPCALGFHPEDSIVLLTCGGEPDGFHARVDLPDDPADLDAVAETILSVARRQRTDRAALVVYTDDQELAVAAAETVRAGLAGIGAELLVAVRADGSRWFSLSGCSGSCRPDEGNPYDIAQHPFVAQAVFEGNVTLPSRAALAESLASTEPEAVAAVRHAATRAVTRFPCADRDPLVATAPGRVRRHLVQEGRWVGHRIRRFLDERLSLEHHEVGRLLVAVASIEVRDVAWAQMTREDARQHVELWRDVVRRSPDELVAPPAALLGFAAWLSGDGALAWCAVDRARNADPAYGLAGLLCQALTAGVPPSAWTPPEPETLTLFAG